RDRPDFARQVIRLFARQTYPRAELVLVDGNDEPTEELCAGVDRVRYVHAAGVGSGEGLNVAARHARGEVFQLLDDDDYYAPSFLERSISALRQARSD